MLWRAKLLPGMQLAESYDSFWDRHTFSALSVWFLIARKGWHMALLILHVLEFFRKKYIFTYVVQESTSEARKKKSHPHHWQQFTCILYSRTGKLASKCTERWKSWHPSIHQGAACDKEMWPAWAGSPVTTIEVTDNRKPHKNQHLGFTVCGKTVKRQLSKPPGNGNVCSDTVDICK